MSGAWAANTLTIDTTISGGIIDLGASALTLTQQAILFRGLNSEIRCKMARWALPPCGD